MAQVAHVASPRDSQKATRLAIFHPSFGTVGGAELLAAAEARVLREHGVDARIVTSLVDHARWHDELQNIPIALHARHSILHAFPWTRAARIKAQARTVQPLFSASDVIIAHNYPCNAILGSTHMAAVRLWQVNEPSRALYLPETDATLTGRVRELGDSAPDWLTRHFAARLRKWEARLARGGKLAAKRACDMRLTARLNGLYAISKYSQAVARRIYGRCSDTVVYPSVRRTVPVVQSRRGIRRNALQVLVQTRLEPVKNVETVLRGFASFAERTPGAQLHVVGEGADRQRLQLIAGSFTTARITFHNFLDSVSLEQLAAQCDVFALLPVDEPFGMVFTEAMTRGLLCIAPNHGGPSEILDDGRLGWVADAFSPNAVTEALDAIVSISDAAADDRRAAALASVQRRFSDEAMFQSLLAVLLEHGVIM